MPLPPGVRRTVDPGNAGDVFSSAGPRSSNRWRGQVLRSAQMLPWLKAIWIFGRHSSLIQLSLGAERKWNVEQSTVRSRSTNSAV